MAFMSITLEDEDITFKCFSQILQMYSRDMFTSKKTKLTAYFSKISKLIELYLPKLAKHFKVVKVS